MGHLRGVSSGRALRARERGGRRSDPLARFGDTHTRKAANPLRSPPYSHLRSHYPVPPRPAPCVIISTPGQGPTGARVRLSSPTTPLEPLSKSSAPPPSAPGHSFLQRSRVGSRQVTSPALHSSVLRPHTLHFPPCLRPHLPKDPGWIEGDDLCHPYGKPREQRANHKLGRARVEILETKTGLVDFIPRGGAGVLDGEGRETWPAPKRSEVHGYARGA